MRMNNQGVFRQHLKKNFYLQSACHFFATSIHFSDIRCDRVQLLVKTNFISMNLRNTTKYWKKQFEYVRIFGNLATEFNKHNLAERYLLDGPEFFLELFVSGKTSSLNMTPQISPRSQSVVVEEYRESFQGFDQFLRSE